jgi:CTP:molybdopterin cytidylyltransferase MocA
MKPTLLVLAAGIGSRYGGIKQIDPVGADGEAIIDYSIYDAIRAGFGRVVFVIRREIEDDVRSFFAGKFEDRIEHDFVHQAIDDTPIPVP